MNLTENYQVTITYKAVVIVSVKAESESIAKERAIDLFSKTKKFDSKKIDIQVEETNTCGCLNMDKSYNLIY